MPILGYIHQLIHSDDLMLITATVLDPVMGDNGRFYVPEELAVMYRKLLPVADLILPNQFELATLAQCSVSNVRELQRAVAILHFKYEVKHVLVTSTELADDEGAGQRTLRIFGSTIQRPEGNNRLFSITVPRYDASFTGTGDMFAALITHAFSREAAKDGLKDNNRWISDQEVKPIDLPLARAASWAVAAMQGVLKKTTDEYNKVEKLGETDKVRLMQALELKILGTMHDVLEPIEVDKFKPAEVKISVEP